MGGGEPQETLQQLPSLSLHLFLAVITSNVRRFSDTSGANSAKEQELLPLKQVCVQAHLLSWHSKASGLGFVFSGFFKGHSGGAS